MKKLICTILSLALALSMAGCGDTAATQAEPTPTPEPTATIEPTPEPLHCDFDKAVEQYKKENSIEEFSVDDEFDFYTTLYSQGINPTEFTCDNEYYQDYLNYWNQLQQAATATPEPQAPSKESGNTYTTKSGNTYPIMEGNRGPTVPVEEIDQFVYEEMGTEIYDKLIELRNLGGQMGQQENISEKIAVCGVDYMRDYYTSSIDHIIESVKYKQTAGNLSSDEAY